MRLTLLALLFCLSALAEIPNGKYVAKKIVCKSGDALKLGGKFMAYKIYLTINDGNMMMEAIAKSESWAPFKLNCTQINEGTFTYTKEGKFEGELPNTSVKCNSPAWTNILKKRLFGVEEFGEFTYSVSGNSVVIYNPNTITKYSCDKAGDYPVYYYNKL